MKRIPIRFYFFSLMLLLVTSVARAEHSTVVDAVNVNGSTVNIVARATLASALGTEMQGRACLADNSEVVLGSTFTFTAVGKQHTFVVENVPSSVLSTDFVVSVTETDSGTDCNNGSEGYSQRVSYVWREAVRPVPTLPTLGLVLLSILLGFLGIRRKIV